jgi:DNA ligase (NAD+)
MDRLSAAGVQMVDEARAHSATGPPPLAGKTYVITGTLESMSREAAAETLQALGAKVSSSVSKKTTGIIVGAEPGSKLEKARAAGVPELDEAAFRDLIMKLSPP